MTYPVAVGLPLRELMERLSTHMDRLAREVYTIELAIAEELGHAGAKTSRNITRLQRLDFLRQSLEDLALLSMFSSEGCRGVIDPAIEQKLRLDVTKQLLRPDTMRPDATTSEEDIGEVDLF